MKKIFVLCTLVLLFSVPAFAGIKNCTNALFNDQVCRVVDANDVLFFDMPDAKMDKLIKKAARIAGFTQNVPCTPELVAEGICTQEELNTSVSKPFMCTNALIARKLCRQAQHGNALSRKDVAFAQLRLYVMNDWMRGEEAQDLRDASDAALQSAINAIQDPDISF